MSTPESNHAFPEEDEGPEFGNAQFLTAAYRRIWNRAIVEQDGNTFELNPNSGIEPESQPEDHV